MNCFDMVRAKSRAFLNDFRGKVLKTHYNQNQAAQFLKLKGVFICEISGELYFKVMNASAYM